MGADTPTPCTVDASCEPGAHTYSWPCDYAPGTGRLADQAEDAAAAAFSLPVPTDPTEES